MLLKKEKRKKKVHTFSEETKKWEKSDKFRNALSNHWFKIYAHGDI